VIAVPAPRSLVIVLVALTLAFVLSSTSLAQEAKEDPPRPATPEGAVPPGPGSGPIPTGAPAGCETYASTNVPVAITDLATVQSTLTIPHDLVISDLNVAFNVTHTFDGDLDIFLRAPSTTQVELTTDNGAAGDNYTNTTFDDEAATAITAGTAPFSGTYRPEGMLSSFDSQLAGGTWTLIITDDLGGDVGTLNSWSIQVCTTIANDAFAGALAFSSLPYFYGQHTQDATTAGNDPTTPCGSGSTPTQSNSVWFNFTPSADAVVNVSTEGSSFDTVVAVYTGAKGSLTPVGCDDDSGTGLLSMLGPLLVRAGTVYHVEVMDFGLPTGGALELSVTAKPLNVDYDGDGCLSDRELGPSAAQGGGRDPTNFWDFFDTPDISNVRDRAIAAADITRVVQRFGSSGDKLADPLAAPPPPPAYHPAFDRTSAGTAPNGEPQGPNGGVTAQDISLSVQQFGHSCT
jgi:subtilisin-like proprotein convertase family protein